MALGDLEVKGNALLDGTLKVVGTTEMAGGAKDTTLIINLNADQMDSADKDTDGALAADSDAKIPSQKAVKTYADARKAECVALTGDQTVAGIKTLSSIPVLPASDPTTDNQAARKAYVDAGDAASLVGQMLHAQDQKAAGTAGGTFNLGAWQTRTLNTALTNTISGASLSANQITLPAGTYFIDASAPAYLVERHKVKLRNITDSSDILIGTSDLSAASSNVQVRSFVSGRFTLAAQKVVALQHFCSASRSSDGLGYPGTLGVIEVYADVKIWKLA